MMNLFMNRSSNDLYLVFDETYVYKWWMEKFCVLLATGIKQMAAVQWTRKPLTIYSSLKNQAELSNYTSNRAGSPSLIVGNQQSKESSLKYYESNTWLGFHSPEGQHLVRTKYG